MNEESNSRTSTYKLKTILKQFLQPAKIPGILLNISGVGLLLGFFLLEKEQYQLVALFLVATVFFAMGLEGLLIFVYKGHTNLNGEFVTRPKAYMLAAYHLIIGWGILILAWWFLSK